MLVLCVFALLSSVRALLGEGRPMDVGNAVIYGIVAALGILGLAVAFAAQDTMENIIAGIFVIVDRPFREGERILLPKKLKPLYPHILKIYL